MLVTDNGLGIPPEARAYVFEPFYRVYGEVGNDGLGLGLSIVQQIAQAHRGLVMLTTPCQSTAPAVLHGCSKHTWRAFHRFMPDGTLARMSKRANTKLLLVEDNDELSRWIVNLLLEEKFAVDCAANGEGAETLVDGA